MTAVATHVSFVPLNKPRRPFFVPVVSKSHVVELSRHPLLRPQFGAKDDDVDAAGVRLGGVHLTASPEGIAAPSSTACRGTPASNGARGGRGGSSRGGGGGDNAYGDNKTSAGGTNGGGDKPTSSVSSPSSSSSCEEGSTRISSRPGADASATGAATPAAPVVGAAAPAGANAVAMSQEREAAERAFASMDQNSGRVSTPRFEELLTLLGTPAARRKGDATESARAAGLLSAYSFSRQGFIDW